MRDRDPAFLRAVIDTLLPRHEGLPSGTEAGVAGALAGHLRTHRDRERFGGLLEAVAARSGDETSFVAANEPARIAALQATEQEAGAPFQELLTLLLADYCETELVLRAFGWSPDPPQPRGFELAPFDEALLEKAKRRGRVWR